MRNLKIALRAFCALPFLTGGLDFVGGAAFLKSAGVPLDEDLVRNAVLDSKVRFWGAIWVGYGVALWRSASRLRTDPAEFRMLCYVLALSGVGRLTSLWRCGFPGVPLVSAMVIEFVGAASALRWHAALMRRRSKRNASRP